MKRVVFGLQLKGRRVNRGDSGKRRERVRENGKREPHRGHAGAGIVGEGGATAAAGTGSRSRRLSQVVPENEGGCCVCGLRYPGPLHLCPSQSPPHVNKPPPPPKKKQERQSSQPHKSCPQKSGICSVKERYGDNAETHVLCLQYDCADASASVPDKRGTLVLRKDVPSFFITGAQGLIRARGLWRGARLMYRTSDPGTPTCLSGPASSWCGPPAPAWATTPLLAHD